jgi:cytochrome c553
MSMNQCAGVAGYLMLMGALAACSGNDGDRDEPSNATARAPVAAAPAPLAAAGRVDQAVDPQAQRQAVQAAAQATAGPETRDDAGVLVTEQVTAQAGEQKAQTCLSCHAVENFAGLSATELQQAMQSMRAGEMAHIPLPATVSDEDLADIAGFLTAANAKP